MVGEALRRFALWAPLEVVADLAAIAGVDRLMPSVPVRLGRVTPVRSNPPPDPNAIVELAINVVETIAGRSPVILAFDDADLCDETTLGVVTGLITLRADLPVLTVISARTTEPDEQPEWDAFVDKLIGSAECVAIELGPLGHDDHQRLVAATSPLAADVASAMSSDLGTLVGESCGLLAGDVVLSLRHLRTCGALTDEREVRSALSTATPYKGLLALAADDDRVFFGRTALVDTLVRRLGTDHFVVLTGASGSGKSSALSAGVAGELRRRGREVTVTSPSDDAGIADVLHGSALGGAGVVVDQFEEVFTLWDSARRERFLDELIDRAERGVYEWLALAVRSDFFGACAEHGGLLRAIDGHTVLVGSLTDDELREIVEGPARVGSLTVEPALTDLVIADLAHDPHPLPLLSHALFETWRRRRSDRLAVVDYRTAGGLRRAIARTADRVYTTQLDGHEQAVARDLLLRLVDVVEDRPPTRRPMPIAQLRDAFGHRADPVLDRLVSARLVVADDRHVALAHEALITEWPRLAEWIDQDRDRLRTMVHLSRAAAEWERGDRSGTDLYRGARLDAASHLVDSGAPLTPSERSFVEAGVAHRENEERRLRRTNRRLRRQLLGVGAAFVVAVGATGSRWGSSAGRRGNATRPSSTCSTARRSKRLRPTWRCRPCSPPRRGGCGPTPPAVTSSSGRCGPDPPSSGRSIRTS